MHINGQWVFAAVMIAVVGRLVWDVFYRRVPFWKIGIAQIIDTVQWLPDAQQQVIYARGWVTKYQWFQIRRRLKRQIARDLDSIGFY